MKSLTVLKPGGLAIGVTGPPDTGFAKQLGAPGNRSSSCCRSSAARFAKPPRNLACATRSSSCTPVAHSFASLGALYDEGHLRPVIDSTFPFDQTLQALAYVENGNAKAGKVVITLD